MDALVYILQKHLPGVTAGVKFIKGYDGYYNPVSPECEMRLGANYVEHMPEWFLPAEGTVKVSGLALSNATKNCKTEKGYFFSTNIEIDPEQLEAVKSAIEFVANKTSNSISDCVEKIHGKKWKDEDMRNAFAAGRMAEEMSKPDFDASGFFGYKWASIHDYLASKGKIK